MQTWICAENLVFKLKEHFKHHTNINLTWNYIDSRPTVQLTFGAYCMKLCWTVLVLKHNFISFNCQSNTLKIAFVEKKSIINVACLLFFRSAIGPFKLSPDFVLFCKTVTNNATLSDERVSFTQTYPNTVRWNSRTIWELSNVRKDFYDM